MAVRRCWLLFASAAWLGSGLGPSCGTCLPATQVVPCDNEQNCPLGYRCDPTQGICLRLDDPLFDAAALDAAIDDRGPRDQPARDRPVDGAAHREASIFEATTGDSARGDLAASDRRPWDRTPDAVVVDVGGRDAPRRDGGGRDARIPDAFVDPCRSDVCGSGELCTAEPDGGWKCSCPGLYCNGICYIGNCCLAAECGSGAWACRNNLCVCDTVACADGHCPGTGECCTTTIDYGMVRLSAAFRQQSYPNTWDVAKCPLRITAHYDALGMLDDPGELPDSSRFGVRTSDGVIIWLVAGRDGSDNTFEPDPVGSPSQDMDDHLMLQRPGPFWDEHDYDFPSPPPYPSANYYMWFDRDGYDASQALNPNSWDGQSYNTGGQYDVELLLTAQSATTGLAFLRINGLDQGFEGDSPYTWSDPIEFTPAGMTFSSTGGLEVNLFCEITIVGAASSVEYRDITARGCLAGCTVPP